MKNFELIFQENWKKIGELLRQSREKIGLTQQDIADKLYLKVSIIHYIEEDPLNINLPTTFLQGYVRSYAKILKIPEEEIFVLTKEKENKTKDFVHFYQKNKDNKNFLNDKNKDFNKKLLPIIILFFGIVGFLFWKKYNFSISDIYKVFFNSD